MTNRRVYKCCFCNHSSMVKSNFRFSVNHKAFCKSNKKLKCEDARQIEDELYRPIKRTHPSYNPINWN